jgi:hypothetical protein
MSKARSFNWKDAAKTGEAFLWSAGSLLSVVVFAVVAMPVEQVPSWVLPLLPTVTFVNTLVYAIMRWYKDNRSQE